MKENKNVLNSGVKKALEEGCPDLLRFMKDNPDYSDIEYIRIDALGNGRARMIVQFENGYQEHKDFKGDEDNG